MMIIGYHASHEQFSPGQLLELAVLAERAGFTGVLSSDHFSPWSRRQGESGFAWGWLGAAMQATSVPYAVVTSPGYRYHPALIAQAAATLSEMFPGRFLLALGSGQHLNERITGARWPEKEDRNRILRESAEIIRDLLSGKKVTRPGASGIYEAELFSRPRSAQRVIGAALTPETAGWMGEWADGMITISRPARALKEIIDAFRQGGGKNKPVYIKVQLSFADSTSGAGEGAWDQWRTNIFENTVQEELRSADQFDAAARIVSRGELKEHILISSDPEQHIHWLREYADMGIEGMFLHNVNRMQKEFIEVFGDKVIPEFARKPSPAL